MVFGLISEHRLYGRQVRVLIQVPVKPKERVPLTSTGVGSDSWQRQQPSQMTELLQKKDYFLPDVTVTIVPCPQ